MSERRGRSPSSASDHGGRSKFRRVQHEAPQSGSERPPNPAGIRSPTDFESSRESPRNTPAGGARASRAGSVSGVGRSFGVPVAPVPPHHLPPPSIGPPPPGLRSDFITGDFAKGFVHQLCAPGGSQMRLEKVLPVNMLCNMPPDAPQLEWDGSSSVKTQSALPPLVAPPPDGGNVHLVVPSGEHSPGVFAVTTLYIQSPSHSNPHDKKKCGTGIIFFCAPRESKLNLFLRLRGGGGKKDQRDDFAAAALFQKNLKFENVRGRAYPAKPPQEPSPLPCHTSDPPNH